MKIRQFKLAILVVLLLVSFTACSSGDSTGQNGKIEVVYWHIGTETWAGPAIKKIVSDFNQQHDDIVVTEKYITGDYQGIMKSLQQDAAAGKSPDVVQIGWSYKEYFANNFEYTVPEQLIATYGSESDKTFIEDTFDAHVKDLAVTQTGNLVGFPYGLSIPVLYVQDDILNAAGVDKNSLTTWPAVREAAKKIKDNTGKIGIYIAEYAYTWELQQMIESNGGQYIENGKCTIASKESEEVYQMYSDMLQVDQSATHMEGSAGQQAFISGEIGMHYGSISSSNTIKNASSTPVTVIGPPTWNGKTPKNPCGGNFLAVTSKDDSKKAATLEFIKFMYQPEYVDEWHLATGYIPMIKDAKDKTTVVKTNPDLQVGFKALENAVQWAAFPGNHGMEAEQILITTRERILGGNVSVEQGLKEAQEDINNLYK